MLGPLRFEPILKEKVWGGEALRDLAGKDVPSGATIGESWELSDRPGDESVVAEGPDAGRSLSDLLAEHGAEVYGAGPGALRDGRFPLLVKFIEAAKPLSVQVHPDDAYTETHGLDDVGKTECWYVLAPPERGLVLGLETGVTRERLAEAVREGRVEGCLHFESVKAGDLVFCPAGVVHASTPPMVFVEIQQNSDVTYRVYDWGRVGLDGKPRELHVEQALETIRFEPVSGLIAPPMPISSQPLVREGLVDCDKFAVERWRVEATCERGDRPDAFEVLICVEGEGAVDAPEGRARLRKGDTVLIPAGVRAYTIRVDTPMKLLRAVAR